jgi:flagellar biosynthesis/type III secretory pathway protein FliH
MTQTARRFLFDEDFGGKVSREGTREIPLSPEALAALEARFEEGRALGVAEAHASMEAQASSSLAAISETMRIVSLSLDRELARMEADSIHMAATLARLYADALIERDPAPMIAEAIRKCSEMANHRPMLTVTIGTAAPPSVYTAITEAAGEVGFAGLVSVREDSSLTPGDVRITWPEGGYLRERTKIDAIVRTMLEMQTLSPPSGTKP